MQFPLIQASVVCDALDIRYMCIHLMELFLFYDFSQETHQQLLMSGGCFSFVIHTTLFQTVSNDERNWEDIKKSYKIQMKLVRGLKDWRKKRYKQRVIIKNYILYLKIWRMSLCVLVKEYE